MINLNSKVSIKNIIITRIYYSSTLKSITDNIAIDGPINIITNLYKSKDPINENKNEIIYQYDNILLWFCITLFCYGIYMAEKTNYNHYKKLQNFINYKKIYRQTSQLVFIIIFIFCKNIENAI